MHTNPQPNLSPQEAIVVGSALLADALPSDDPRYQRALCSYIDTAFSHLDCQARDRLLSPANDEDQVLTMAIKDIMNKTTQLLDALAQSVKETLNIELTIQKLRSQRINDHGKEVYVAPQAKASLRASDNDTFPLMENSLQFLNSERLVMLVLGDSGVGKSTFNRQLEYELWKGYQEGRPVLLLINLPVIDDPTHSLVEKQLERFGFLEGQMEELKHSHSLVLVCDGFDESQVKCNLHTLNRWNQPGGWNIKMADVSDLFQEAVITSFSPSQIEDYIQQYINLTGRSWTTEDVMDKLASVSNLLDLIKNPFLLTLALEALPKLIGNSQDRARMRASRVDLYDSFVEQWLDVNRERLEFGPLTPAEKQELDSMLDDGFGGHVVKYMKDLAAAVFKEQEGNPVI
ncbi:WD_REPEATS_REGION domain-containing protein [Mortierella sp. AD031]|nr:WD_REPEATS_REGION domain-containing protein [Mortierella sp. AD031]